MTKNIVCIVGTRPEAVKMAPVILRLRRHGLGCDVRVLATGQHRGLLDQALNEFGIEADLDLDLMRADQGLADLAMTIMRRSGVEVELIRAVDHEIATGVWPDMTEHGWERDDWPGIFERVMAADILVLLTPIPHENLGAAANVPRIHPIALTNGAASPAGSTALAGNAL